MSLKDILNFVVLLVLGIFMVAKLNKIIGLLLISAAVIILIIMLKDSGIIKKKSKKANEEAETIRRKEEIEKLGEYDYDSGKGYCPQCGNYGVNSDKVCESCGEKVID